MIKQNRPLSSINLNHYFLHPLKASLWGALRTFIVSFVIGCMVALHNIFYEPFTAKILAHPLLSFIAFGILGGLIQLQGVSNRHYAKQANYRQIKRYLDKAESAVEVFLNSALFELYELILFKQENLLTNEQFDNKKNEYIHNELLCSTYDFILLVELKNDLLISDASLEFKKYAFLQNNEPVSKDTLKELLKLEIINESEYNYKIERSKRDRNSQWVKNIIGSVIAVGAVVVMIAIKLHNRQS